VVTSTFVSEKIYYYFGESYYRQSLQYLDKALATGSTRHDLYYLSGVVHSYLGQYQQAIDMFITAADKGKSDLVYLAIGMTFFKMDDYENSRKYVQAVLDTNPTDVTLEKALFLLGEISFSEKKYLEALDFFDKVVALNENNARAYFYRGEIYFHVNQPVRARAEWRKTLDIDPSHIRAKKRIYY
jgi:tetratricopeptide (TPR) repeat protein